jgi:predicted DNA-binding transcriptional regulator YafY
MTRVSRGAGSAAQKDVSTISDETDIVDAELRVASLKKPQDRVGSLQSNSKPTVDRKAHVQVKDVVETAIREQKILSIKYESHHKGHPETTTRDIEPMQHDATYCYAFCRLRQDFRQFRMSRISSAKIAGATFVMRPIVRGTNPWQREDDDSPVFSLGTPVRSGSISEWVWGIAALLFLAWLFFH